MISRSGGINMAKIVRHNRLVITVLCLMLGNMSAPDVLYAQKLHILEQPAGIENAKAYTIFFQTEEKGKTVSYALTQGKGSLEENRAEIRKFAGEFPKANIELSVTVPMI
jgi:hypothetical protein